MWKEGQGTWLVSLFYLSERCFYDINQVKYYYDME